MKNRKGFTLVELLAVIVILAIILVIAVPSIMDTINQARLSSFQSSAKMLVSAAEKDFAVKLATGNNTNDVYSGTGSSNSLNCGYIADISQADYEDCVITIESGNTSTNYGKVKALTLTGSDTGKFKGYECHMTASGSQYKTECTKGN